ncbi:DUF7507 domain-containing protein [Martelella mediterranea]|nr:DUF11 domain-containing protein [Martelella mediterranea]
MSSSWLAPSISDIAGPLLFIAMVIAAFVMMAMMPAHQAHAQSIPTISCSTDANLFNTGFNPSTGGNLTTGQDRNWEVSTLQPAYYEGRLPPALSYRPATVVDSPSNQWTSKRNASWISLSNTGHQGPPNESNKRTTYRDLFFRYQFKLDPQVDLNSIRLDMDFYADDGIYQVWVNKTPQGVRSQHITPDYARPSMYTDPSDDYYWANSYKPGNQEAGALSSGFQSGLNEIVVQIKSQAEHVGLQAHFTGTLGICHPELTVKQKSSLVNTGRDAKPGDEISIKADITNTGRLDFSRVEASDSIRSVTLSPNNFALAKSKLTSVSGRYSITQDDIDRGSVDNTVSAKGTASNGTSSPNVSDPQTIQIPRNADMSVSKTSSGDGDAFTGTLSYKVEVTNTGNVTLTNIRPADPHLDAPLQVQSGSKDKLLPGQKVVFTGKYTPKPAEIDAGSFTNTVKVTANTPPGAGTGGGSTIEKQDSDTADLRKPEIQVEQSTPRLENSSALPKAKDKVRIEAKVSNKGTLDFTKVDIANTLKPLTVDPSSFSLARNGERTVSGSYVLTQEDINRGAIENTLKAVGTARNGATVQDDDRRSLNLSRNADMSVEKTSSGGGDAFTGKLSYTVKVTNTGNVTLTNIRPEDPHLDAPLQVKSGSSAKLEPGEQVVFTGQYTPQQAEIDTGSFTNTVKVTATTPPGAGAGGGSTIEKQDSNKAGLPEKPGLTVTKEAATPVDANGNGFIDAGDTIAYTITATNTGNVSLTDFTVEDPLLDAGSVSGNGNRQVEPQGQAVFTGKHTIKQSEIDAGKLKNVATVHARTKAGTPVQNKDEATVTFADNSDIGAVKTAEFLAPASQSNFKLGDKIRYTVKVTNKGNRTLSNIRIEEALDGVDLVPSDPNLTQLKPAQQAFYTGLYTPKQSEIDQGKLINKVTVSAVSSGGKTVSVPAEVETKIESVAKMALTKTAHPRKSDGRFSPGDVIDYDVVVSNEGNVTLSSIRAEDAIPGLTLSPVGNFNGTLLPREEVTFKTSYTLKASDIDSGALVNTATANAKSPSGAPVKASDEARTEFAAFPAIEIEKKGSLNDTNGNDAYDVGETIDYTITVWNRGNVTLTDVLPKDTVVLDNGKTKSLALEPSTPQTIRAGESIVFKATYTVVQEDVDAGGMKNTATVSGKPPRPDEKPPEDGDEVRVADANAKPAINATRKANLEDENRNELGDEGEKIAVSTLITNTGTVTLYNVTLEEKRAGAEARDVSIKTLAPGEDYEVKDSYALTADDVQAGRSKTEATPVGQTANKEEVRGDPVSAEVTWAKPSTLVVEKKGTFVDVNNDGFASTDDVIEYAITVTNDGGQNIKGVSPQDEGIVLPDKTRGTGTLTDFEPKVTDLGPGEAVTFKTRYVLTKSDLDKAAGLDQGIVNTATATGKAGTQDIPAKPGSATTVLPMATPSDITLIKESLVSQIRRGEKAPFVITVINNTQDRITDLAIVDKMPGGFRFDEGSGSVNGEKVKPVVSGRNVRFENITVEPGGKAYVRLNMTALSTLSPGKYENEATAIDHFNRPLSPKATASITIKVDPVFDCGDIIGRVFDDANGDGYADDGETGLPGVRVATAYGLLVTTDEYGRFHVACADLPDKNIGSNFIMKLDERTLPSGYRVTSENPRVVRLTAGKTVKLNFGASAGHMVDVDLAAAAFVPDTIVLKDDWQSGLDQLVSILASHQSRLRLNYLIQGSDPLADQRLKAVAQQIEGLWKARRLPGKPDISMRIEISE